jgi:hypothetical protein
MRVVKDLDSDEVAILIWEEGRKLGHSREEVDAMLASGKYTPRQLLRKLESRVSAANSLFEREQDERWHARNSEISAVAFEQSQLAALADLHRIRAEQSLSDRVFRLLVEAGFASETRASALAEKTTSGEPTRTVPRLDDRALIDVVREILEAAILRCEDEVDRVVRSLPARDIHAEILATKGHPTLCAIRHGVSESQVRKLRTLAGLQSRNGWPKKDTVEK